MGISFAGLRRVVYRAVHEFRKSPAAPCRCSGDPPDHAGASRETLGNKRVGDYNLRRLLGSGGMGEVYLADHRTLKRPCAVKLMRPGHSNDPQLIARFEREVRVMAKLTHPNTVAIYDSGITNEGAPFYVMEFLPGLSLQEIVERTGPMPAARVIHLLRQVCAALGEAHRHGIIHRDIKPANIIATERGGIYDFAKLFDFGLVKATVMAPEDVQLTHEGVMVGSPLYAAPEVALGDGAIDARTDIYSLGATAYFLLTGQPVFPGDKPLRIVLAHACQEPVPPSEVANDIPPDLEAIVLKCLAKSPDARYGMITDLVAALARCARQHRWTPTQAKRWWRETADFTCGEVPIDPEEVTAQQAQTG